jgi:hypothetical protein
LVYPVNPEKVDGFSIQSADAFDQFAAPIFYRKARTKTPLNRHPNRYTEALLTVD